MCVRGVNTAPKMTLEMLTFAIVCINAGKVSGPINFVKVGLVILVDPHVKVAMCITIVHKIYLKEWKSKHTKTHGLLTYKMEEEAALSSHVYMPAQHSMVQYSMAR